MYDRNSGYNNNPPPPPSMSAYPARESDARRRNKKRRVQGGTGGWTLVIISAVVVMFAVFSTVIVTLYITLGNQPQEVIPTAVLTLPTPVNARQDFSGEDFRLTAGSFLQLDDGREIIVEPWDGESRFTILMMGLDRRPG
ncbi:MAG: hypothetical protein AAGK74_13735, partial [Chloroflexota bacterium]